MVQLVVGERGKGKTKCMLDSVNQKVKEANGNIAYLDKSQKHMYDLSTKVRLIDVSEFPISNAYEFLGFICGIISEDHDLEWMYFDSFLTIASAKEDELEFIVEKLEQISTKFTVNFILCISLAEESLSASLRDKVQLSV